MTEQTKIPSYNDVIKKGCSHFLQELNEGEVMENTNGSRIVECTVNQDSGGEFLIKDTKTNKSGILFVYGNDLYDNKLYIINRTTKEITPVDCNNLEDFKERYKIFYRDKQSIMSQLVSIEDENNIQTDKGVVLSFDEIDSKNPNSKLYLSGIYNGEFKEQEIEITDTETKEKTTRIRKLLTGNANIFYQNGNIAIQGSLENGLFKQGKLYIKDGTLRYEGTFTKSEYGYIVLHGDDCKNYYPITIQQGQFKDGWLYSGSAYLREDPTDKSIEEINNEQINPENKIYTLERDKENSNIRTLKFHTKHPKIGLDRNIVINIDKNNIATLQTIDGKSTELTKEEINKIKAFFNNIPIEQLDGFDPYLTIVYYTIIMNKEEYKDINILIPDECEYNYKPNQEVTQTIDIINQIPQNERKGKYIIPCDWLKNEHQVNLRIDFDNKICEIVNTGDNVDMQVINNLKQELNNQFKEEENWVVCENHIVAQSTGNCVIASNIVSTEKVMLEKQVEEYNERINKLREVDKKINDLQQPEKQQQTRQQIEQLKTTKKKEKEELEEEIQQYLNLIVSDDKNKKITKLKDFEKNIKSFSEIYDKEIRKIIGSKLATEREKLITTNLLLKERLLHNEYVNNQFDKQMTNIVISNKKAIII